MGQEMINLERLVMPCCVYTLREWQMNTLDQNNNELDTTQVLWGDSQNDGRLIALKKQQAASGNGSLKMEVKGGLPTSSTGYK